MMDDDRLSEHLKPVEFLDICLGDNLPHPGVHPRETRGLLDPPEPCGEQTWAFDAPDFTRQDGPPRGTSPERMHLGSSSSQGGPGQKAAPPGSPRDSHPLGSPRQSQSTSTQVMFWAGILQAQMCVLDLEEELEKTEGLRAELRCCLPTAPTDLPTFPSAAGHRDSGLRPSLPVDVDEASGEDSSGPEVETQNPGWRREGVPDSSPEWGPEEESVFFDNPVFLESPCSDTSASEAHFSWGFSDFCADVRTGPLESPLPGGRMPWEQGQEPDLGDGTAHSSSPTTPPFPVPTYRPHSFSWAVGDASTTPEGPPTAPPSQEESETPLGDSHDPAPPVASCVDKALTWETGPVGSASSPAIHPVQPWQTLPSPEAWQTEDVPSWPREALSSQDRGDRDTECPQESAPCAVAPGPWESPASSPEPSSPESEARGPGPQPSPVSSQEGSPQLRGCPSGGVLPKWTLDASSPSLLETDGADPSSLEKEEAGEAPKPEKEIKREGPARPAEAGAVRPDNLLPSAEGCPKSPMPQVQSPEEGQRPQAGDKLANGVRTDKGAWNLASRLYHLEGFRKSEVAAYLQKNNDFSRAVAEQYLSFFQFGGQSLDRALRGFLQALVLSGETQERERILYQFSRRFHYCNPGLFSSVDSVHTLTCAIMLLNTDLHGQNIGKSMSCQEFITNLNGLRDGGNFPKELLKALYWSIRSEKLEWAVDEEDAARPEKARPPPLAGKMSNPFLQLAQDPTVPTYKQGILARKMHQDADGKKTPWGKRGWKMLHTLLRGMVLYFLKGEDHGLEGESLVGQMVDEPVGVHHSLATPATHYTKKPHVFQLRTADWRLYLFQAPTAQEMSSWIARINLAAATHSAPPFPAAVGSQRRFVRPILPVGPAQSSLEEQHRSHENCLDAASDDLLDLQRTLPERRGRSRELEDYRLRKEYLEYEKTRYETYVQLLVARLHCPSDDLDQWEEQLGREAGGAQEPKPSLKKSHSSPSLHQDEAPTTAKVKRNISERRTYRKIIPKRNRNQL
ncbi:PH and SEC7 domain-containing protein 4 isoform X1 [Camelus ferus]|uniref:PH and SEC7 domain-containing protein 4 n=2 Tax=Camelus ferus TaxID=419612 RepID=A0A8B8S6J6_CAMFR|nr:PH and SEC7 domain-containing protein 4 isoform X1 [Camelus ferus]XP_032325373.1 PH and SEC7 domain-containing protein 4 isoform X1 [Camelus ferus]XP_032325374.1 PH and SEC7 domain-containing protein 4 isoform X1 [Camelus ferus]XP_032325375.1 PH and SEC7 domain-containing protein 4 isoform X1 [Camelus ferus]XP_032325376.1 PH and SEC7 domain-containing protein 4 isoform X1 [Camelus ferus]XP_032325377.1 PH and SEC7 domain-containing protein 4 isoform X1 [Camelus ferus]